MTSDDIIASVKRRAMIPGSQSTFTDADFLAFGDEEMSLGLVPSVLRIHEDYLLWAVDVPMVNSQSSYIIPYRAIGNKLREVSFKDNNNNIIEMTRISVEQLPDYNGRSSTSNRIYAYYIQNNKIVLVPTIATGVTGSIRFTYYLKPNKLVKLNRVAVIQSIDRNTGDVVVGSIPSEFAITKKIDLISTKSPHATLNFDILAANINNLTNTITFNLADLPADLEVGDHVCMAAETAIPQIPSDLHVVLAHRIAARCLEAMGDTEGLQAANVKLAEMETNTNTLIDNRSEGSPKKVFTRHGFLRQGITNRRNTRVR